MYKDDDKITAYEVGLLINNGIHVAARASDRYGRLNMNSIYLDTDM